MFSKQEAHEKIAALAEKFKKDPKRHAYNEDETRHFYILPLFRYLGWDTENPAEFSAEEQISRGFVDFGFYLNGVPQFYLETKSARQKLDKPENMKQSINYSFLKGVTWATLSDFERLMVFNADWEEKDPEKARFLDLHFEHYANGDFDKLWLLSKESMQGRQIDKTAESFGKKAKKEPVTVSLFNDLTDWRRRLFNEIRLQRANLWAEDSRAVDNAVQKFFDRLIFIRTVEDRGIEENRLKPLMRQTKKQEVIFDNLQKLFRELDKVYNSNLFAEHDMDRMQVYDPDLIEEIINGLYKPKGKLLEYDFNAITADILGAVYEQYLGFKAVDPDAKQDTSKSRKRKSQGIFYTPQYVVRYIVQQTLGRLLQDGADPHKLTVIDPACGSGSFLIEAFDVLDRWLANKEPDVPTQERRERILKENIFGVDLDEQAIEVTRLNLMLRASFERRKLPYLTNIRHGNSLIASDEIAGKGLGFNWQERFADIFERGGFDVVVGNPPYVRQETVGAAFKSYAEDIYQTYAGTADLYVYFMEKGYQLLRENGRMGYIVPNKWLRANYGQSLREFLKDKIERLIDFGDLPVFAEATTYPLITTLHKSVGTQSIAPVQVVNVPNLPNASETLDSVLPSFYPVMRSSLDKRGWSLANIEGQKLLDKLTECGISLGEYVGGKIFYGIKTGLNEAFVINRQQRKALIDQDPKSAELIKPFLAGRDSKRYEQPKSDNYLIYVPWRCPIEDYPAILQHLEQFRLKLSARPEVKQNRFPWYALSRYASEYIHEYEQPKIVYLVFQVAPAFGFDTNKMYGNNAVWIIPRDDKFLLGILNSKLGWYCISQFCTKIQNGYQLIFDYFKKVPIRRLNLEIPEEANAHRKLVMLVELMLKLKAEYAELENTVHDRRHEVLEQIERTDKAIDKAVYALYNLTPEEIAIVEA